MCGFLAIAGRVRAQPLQIVPQFFLNLGRHHGFLKESAKLGTSPR